MKRSLRVTLVAATFGMILSSCAIVPVGYAGYGHRGVGVGVAIAPLPFWIGHRHGGHYGGRRGWGRGPRY